MVMVLYRVLFTVFRFSVVEELLLSHVLSDVVECRGVCAAELEGFWGVSKLRW
ncbi:hypothetical protein A2U01_0068404, partial [Trifolium medium]|nr:hypothetical protein [Trifolium medium]